MAKWLFLFSALILIFTIYFHTIIEFDQDLGRHLITGKIISETYQIPKTNLFSYTNTNFPFVNTHWLAEVIFYQTSQLFGITSLPYLKIIIMLTACFLTILTALKKSKSFSATAIAFIFLVPMLLERTEIRPEIFSYLFAAIFIFILNKKNISKKEIIFLSIIQTLWVNIHIYFFLGPTLILIHLIAYRKNLLLTFIPFLILLNPNFITGALYPLQVMQNYGYSIAENQAPLFLESLNFFNPNILYLKIAAIVLVVSFFIYRKNLLRPLSLIAFLGLTLAFLHVRSLPFLFFLSLPAFAINLTKFNKYSTVILTFAIITNIFRANNLATNNYYQQIFSPKKFSSEIVASYKPSVDFVIKNNLKGPIFNSFDNGSYLDYRLYPKEKVFVDGRPEAYPSKFFQNIYIPMQMTTENFNEVDKIYNFNLIIFPHTDQTPWGEKFLIEITKNKNWNLVFLDPSSVVFIKTSSNPASAEKYKITSAPAYTNNIHLARIYSLFNWPTKYVGSQKLDKNVYF